MNELEALVALTHIPFLGSVKIRLLLQQFGSALHALNVDLAEIAKLPGFGKKILSHWPHWKNTKWQEDLELVHRYSVKLVPFTSSDYPTALREILDFPLLLYILGELREEDSRSIAIVGTRNSSIYGKEAAEKISADLASMGYTIVSGLARGIDTAAHQGALKQGRTLGVIGSGLANLYPKENAALAREMIKKGALISELPMLTPPEKHHFPRRNRIVCGMTQAILLIEAPLKSGAMLTMQNAQDQKKKLFALPGCVDNENFKGNHLLIKNGHATPVENADDIASFFEGCTPFRQEKESINTHLTPEEQKLIAQLSQEKLSVEHIEQVTHIPLTKLNVLLTGLVLKKAIKEFPGKMYKKAGK